MIDLPSGLVSFLMTDIEDSTRHWERDPAAMQISQQLHDQLLEEAISANNGAIFKSLGDGCLAVFADTLDAARAAAAVQQDLAQIDWPGDDPLHVRISVHSGEAIAKAGDYQSIALNRVARLISAGHGGQILLSDRSAGMISGRLPSGYTLISLGRHHLPGLIEGEQIWQLSAPGLEIQFPALESLSPPTNLPNIPDRLIGREEALTGLTSLFATPSIGVVTITGPGGIGKTRFALEAGRSLLERFPDGVWFVDLSPVRDPDLVAATIAEVLGLRTEREGGAEQALASKWMYVLIGCFCLANNRYYVGKGFRLAGGIRRE